MEKIKIPKRILEKLYWETDFACMNGEHKTLEGFLEIVRDREKLCNAKHIKRNYEWFLNLFQKEIPDNWKLLKN